MVGGIFHKMCAESFAFAEFLRDTSSKKVYDDSHASSCVGTDMKDIAMLGKLR